MHTNTHTYAEAGKVIHIPTHTQIQRHRRKLACILTYSLTHMHMHIYIHIYAHIQNTYKHTPLIPTYLDLHTCGNIEYCTQADTVPTYLPTNLQTSFFTYLHTYLLS